MGSTRGFARAVTGLLAGNMVLQARAGADCVAIFDTAAARWTRRTSRATPQVRWRRSWRNFAPSADSPLIYYSRDTGPEHWRALEPLDIQCLGVDWRHELAATLSAQTPRWSLQAT